jgi:acyl carrier protein
MTTATTEALARLAPHARIGRRYDLPDDGACVDIADAAAAGLGPIVTCAPFGGVPIAVLGADLRPIAEGATGEVYFRGPRLPRGYLGRAWPTAERFVADPAGHGDVLYRTGELGRTRPDGGIEFLGPVDTVTWQGHRVVLGEIEMVLREAIGVRDAAAALRRVGERDELVAYIVATSGGRSVVDLKADVQRRLPSHLCPTTFVALERLPRTPSGQLDRAALPSPDPILRPVEQPYAPPQNAVEAALVEIWAEVLLLDRVGIHDDFLDIGGDSLLAMQITGRIWDQFAREIPLQTFFEQCTIATLAQDYLMDAVEAAEDASVRPH